MPLLKRKRHQLLPPPPFDSTRKESRDRVVWYSPWSHEIFVDYPTYLERFSLYRKPIWQCESTGRSNLTFRQAVESERTEKERVQDKLPEQLQKRVLQRAQFQTSRLDAIVEDVYHHFVEQFLAGEFVNCVWDDGIAYTAHVLEVLPSNTNSKYTDMDASTEDQETQYKVQLVDQNMDGIEDCIKTVTKKELKRDRLAFSKNLLKKFIRECTTKESYIGAPLIVKENVAERFGISTALSFALQEAKEQAYSKSRKRRLPEAKEAQENGKSANGVIDPKKVDALVKYPMEDLDLPVYRRSTSGVGNVIDMTPGKPHAGDSPLNGTGGMPKRPDPLRDSSIPAECYGSFLMVWCFLSVFSRPLGLFPFSLDDFQCALRHRSTEPRARILIESNACLLNLIIHHRHHSKLAVSSAPALTITAVPTNLSHRSSRSTTPVPKKENGIDRQAAGESDTEQNVFVPPSEEPLPARRLSTFERGCGSFEVASIATQWDHKPIRAADDRHGWEDVLIGFINEYAPLDNIDEFDRILSRLVPRTDSTLDEREAAYASLKLVDKIRMFELLVSVANECGVIKEYMEECRDQMTELRKQKNENSRERKRINAERLELDKQSAEEDGERREESSDSEDDSDASDSENLRKAQRQAEQASRHESRQAILRRKQEEREQQEAKRIKLHHQQREEARIRKQELKAKADIRRKLDEEERRLRKNQEQIERDMRKYNTLRIKPLGRDKFYNRYYYLDNIGGSGTHGSGKLFVQSPSEIDLEILRERDDPASVSNESALPCGRGGGIHFVSQLMKEQGMVDEGDFLAQRMRGASATVDWWHFYEDPEEIEQLMQWLNPKGVREHHLRREMDKQMHTLTLGMKRRSTEQNTAKDIPRRSTRSKGTDAAFPPGSWLAYTNKSVKN